jgi:hypothetical protein
LGFDVPLTAFLVTYSASFELTTLRFDGIPPSGVALVSLPHTNDCPETQTERSTRRYDRAVIAIIEK